MGRPKKDPAEKMVRIDLTVRPQDARILQLLAFEQFSLVGTGAGGNVNWRLVRRPSMSSAVRKLIDEERGRRVRSAIRLYKDGQLSEEELLRNDPVFGSLFVRGLSPPGIHVVPGEPPPPGTDVDVVRRPAPRRRAAVSKGRKKR